MKKQPLFDVGRFNRLADKYNVPWIDRIPLIETVCWGSKGWIDPELANKMKTEYAPLMKTLGVKVADGYVYVRQPKPRKAQSAA